MLVLPLLRECGSSACWVQQWQLQLSLSGSKKLSPHTDRLRPCHLLQAMVCIVELLLKHGADLSGTDQYHRTPMIVAADRGHGGILDILLEADAKRSSRTIETCGGDNPLRRSPLLRALEKGHHNVRFGPPWLAVMHLQRCFKICCQSAAFACIRPQISWISKLSMSQAVLALTVTSCQCYHGIGPTMIVRLISLLTLQATDALLFNGADVHARDADRRTALHIAASSGNTDIVKLVLEYGGSADIRAPDTDAYLPQDMCSLDPSSQEIRALLDVTNNIMAKQ